MRKKKGEESAESAEKQALEKSVDQMMDPKIPDPKPPKLPDMKLPKAVTDSSDSETHTIAVKIHKPAKSETTTAEQATAPELPDDLKKELPEDSLELPEEAKKTVPAAAAAAVDETLEEANAATSLETDDIVEGSTDIENEETDKAVDDIASKESNTILALQDAKKGSTSSVPKNTFGGFKDKLKRLLKNKWTWIILGIIAVIIFAIPATRYTILGLFIKKSVQVQVVDSIYSTPVSNAQVKLGGGEAKTDGNGKAVVKARLGKSNLEVSKQYYLTSRSKYLVGLKSAPKPKVKLVATGRLVPIKVSNKITGKPMSGAQIAVFGTTAKTDKKGNALVALPTNTATQSAKISAPGFNTAATTVVITDKVLAANSFTLTPSGQVYFLSNLNGTLDVVKTNLDGTGRKVVLKGTGQEDKPNTSLLASRDWKYLVLKSRRAGNYPGLYLIDTSNDKITQFENSDSTSNLVGWYGHDFVFDLTKNNNDLWTVGRQTLKSYDAEHLQLNQLDSNQAEGTVNSYAYQTLGSYYLVNGQVVYTVQWNQGFSPTPIDLSSKNDNIRGVQPNGNSKKDYQSLPSDTTGYISAVLSAPQTIYYSVPNEKNTSVTYYEYENQSAKVATDMTQARFNQDYPTYLLSPLGTQSFWTDLRDGKNTLFLGGPNANNPKQIATLSDYAPYGWFTESYALVSKNSSELYIMPAGPVSSTYKPVKITDYYKPAKTFNGYGYGYGGL